MSTGCSAPDAQACTVDTADAASASLLRAQATTKRDSAQALGKVMVTGVTGRGSARAASGIEHFDELLNATATTAPLRRTVESSEVGRTALLLASDYTSAVTGEVLHVDSGFHIEGMAFH